MFARRAELRDRRPAWTLALIAAAFLGLTPTIGLVSTRARGAAELPGDTIPGPEHEPPPSPLAAPPIPSEDPPPPERTPLAAEVAPEPDPPPAASDRPAPELASLEVAVMARGRAAPLAWVELVHEPAEGAARVLLERCDEAGLLRLALAPGRARAVAWSEDANALPASAELAPGRPAALELALEPAFPVAGRVTDARTGAPVAGAEVAFWTFAERDTVVTGPDGTFRHPRFPARAPAQQVSARASGYGRCVRYLRVKEDGSWKLRAATEGEASTSGAGTPWVELALVPELRVTGRVLDELGLPITGARVSAEGYFHALPSVASRDGAETTSDAEGRFELGGLRSDVGHSLLAEAPGRAAALLELASVPGTTDAGDLRLARETVLAGVVIDADGMPLGNVEVVLRVEREELPGAPSGALDVPARVQGRELRARTDAAGTFLFEHLEPRAVRVSVEGGAGARVEETLAPRADGSFESPCLVLPPARVALR
jgi:protocatechuate 3,4-dioxygenase beta subunit